MNQLSGKVVSLHTGDSGDLGKPEVPSLQFEMDGVVGDRHRSYLRKAWEHDKQPQGTVRRNERQWSAVSIEELVAIQEEMNLATPLTAASLGANLCLQGIPKLSRLPKGTLLQFPSGVELMVEEYNPPCLDMGRKLAALHTTNSGQPLTDSAFSQAAKFSRGLVGVVELGGEIKLGDTVVVVLYQPPRWITRSSDS